MALASYYERSELIRQAPQDCPRSFIIASPEITLRVEEIFDSHIRADLLAEKKLTTNINERHRVVLAREVMEFSDGAKIRRDRVEAIRTGEAQDWLERNSSLVVAVGRRAELNTCGNYVALEEKKVGA
jgi:hypothetical protein